MPIAWLLASCAVPDAPPHVSIYAAGAYEPGRAPKVAADVDFQRHTILVDVNGERYTGDLIPRPDGASVKSELRSPSGATMECYLDRLLPEVWRGRCTDLQKHVFMLEVGHPWHV